MSATEVRKVVELMVGDDLHALRVLSLSNAVHGVMAAASLSVCAIGRGLAREHHLDPKHATKQVDRLLSNSGIDTAAAQQQWARHIVGERKQIVVALDWTEFDRDGHSTIALSLVTSHGRATPLIWKSVGKSELKNQRNDFETEVIERLHEALPTEVEVTLLADRGFGDQKRYAVLDLLGWYYVIRFRSGIFVTDAKGERRTAKQWLHPSGRSKILHGATVTANRGEVGAVVVTHQKDMKEPWCLAVRMPNATAGGAVKLYGKRFTIEETFRDTKDSRFGMGLSASRVRSPARRDRLLLLAALAQSLLTLLGAACEDTGFDRRLKVNTSPKRQHSLLFQGTYWFNYIPRMDDDELNLLMCAFDARVRQHSVYAAIFGVL